jgi:RNA polymerase sigma factor (sigma-70 family)
MNDNLELLWNQYSRRLRAFIRSRVGDDADAEDILQEVFIRVHRNLCCLPEPEWHRPESWFYQIARHLIIDHYRRRRVLVAIPEKSARRTRSAGRRPRSAAGALVEGADRRATRALPPGPDPDGIPGPEPKATGRAPGHLPVRGEVTRAARPPKAA